MGKMSERKREEEVFDSKGVYSPPYHIKQNRKGPGPEKMERKFWHRKDVVLWCPHCQKTFLYHEMWKKIVMKISSVVELSRLFNRTSQEIRFALDAFKLDKFVVGTRRNNDWHKLAKLAGYEDPYVMFYHMVVQQKMTWARMSRVLDVDRQELIDMSKVFLQPHTFESSKRARINRHQLRGINLEEAQKVKDERKGWTKFYKEKERRLKDGED